MRARTGLPDMTKKEILHEVIRGMDAYESSGVPVAYWNLAVELTKEIYGEVGVSILEAPHIVNRNSIDAETTLHLHLIYGWEDNGNTEIGPKEVIERLKGLTHAKEAPIYCQNKKD